jgi:hypothetical protein
MVSRLPNCFFNSIGNETLGSVASTEAGIVRHLPILSSDGRLNLHSPNARFGLRVAHAPPPSRRSEAIFVKN